MGFFGTLRKKIKIAPLHGAGIREILQNNPRIGYSGAGTLSLALLFCFFMIVWLVNGSHKADQAAAEAFAETFGDLSVSQDELFWPSEPDLVPPVQLERLPRGSSGTDNAPYWIDPQEQYAAQWRERIGSAVDEVMEKVP
jgi:hypothetical protein